MPKIASTLSKKGKAAARPTARGEREAQSLRRRRRLKFVQRLLPGVVLVIGVIGGVYLWRSGLIQEAADVMVYHGDKAAKRAGLTVTEIHITGQQETALKDIRTALGIVHGQSVFSFELEGARKRVEALKWVANASVARRLPNHISVHIEEHIPAALWQHDQKVWLLTREGIKITDQRLAHFYHLPLVVGRGADDALDGYLALAGLYPSLFGRVESAVRVSERRWDLTLDNGVRVRLPDSNVEQACLKLVELEKKERLFARDIYLVDLRIAGRMVIRLSEEAAKMRRQNLKTIEEDI